MPCISCLRCLHVQVHALIREKILKRSGRSLGQQAIYNTTVDASRRYSRTPEIRDATGLTRRWPFPPPRTTPFACCTCFQRRPMFHGNGPCGGIEENARANRGGKPRSNIHAQCLLILKFHEFSNLSNYIPSTLDSNRVIFFFFFCNDEMSKMSS